MVEATEAERGRKQMHALLPPMAGIAQATCLTEHVRPPFRQPR
jgi:hypothetical protein